MDEHSRLVQVEAGVEPRLIEHQPQKLSSRDSLDQLGMVLHWGGQVHCVHNSDQRPLDVIQRCELVLRVTLAKLRVRSHANDAQMLRPMRGRLEPDFRFEIGLFREAEDPGVRVVDPDPVGDAVGRGDTGVADGHRIPEPVHLTPVLSVRERSERLKSEDVRSRCRCISHWGHPPVSRLKRIPSPRLAPCLRGEVF